MAAKKKFIQKDFRLNARETRIKKKQKKKNICAKSDSMSLAFKGTTISAVTTKTTN